MKFNYVNAHRKRLGLSQNELGYLLGFSGNTAISRIETGKHDPHVKDMVALECLFGCSSNTLFPDLYSDVTHHIIRRLDLFDSHLKEEPENQANMLKLQGIRDIRKRLSEDNDSRV